MTRDRAEWENARGHLALATSKITTGLKHLHKAGPSLRLADPQKADQLQGVTDRLEALRAEVRALFDEVHHTITTREAADA